LLIGLIIDGSPRISSGGFGCKEELLVLVVCDRLSLGASEKFGFSFLLELTDLMINYNFNTESH
jgi:hypothetical protein